jgi:hypothetical protein
MLHYTGNYSNAIEIKLTNSMIIPANGSIEVEFMTSNSGFARDLGLGMVSYEEKAYPCEYTISIIAEFSGCTVKAGTSIDPAYVKFNGIDKDLPVGTDLTLWIP